MKKLMTVLASCAICAVAASQPMPPPGAREGDRMDNHEMDRHAPDHPSMAHPAPPHHHKHKVWVPSRHDEHGHSVPGHYVYR
jgi:hypothetical protein